MFFLLQISCVREHSVSRFTLNVSHSSESISAVKDWLKKLPSEGADAVDCGSETLDKPQIAAIEKAVLDMQVSMNVDIVFTV